MVVFDELPTGSAHGPDGEIDADALPELRPARRDATWYRNATTVHEWTTGAVPADADRRCPDQARSRSTSTTRTTSSPWAGGAYDLHVFESQTQLCPPELCARRTASRSSGA